MSDLDEPPMTVVLKLHSKNATGIAGLGCNKWAFSTYPNVYLKKKFDFRKVNLNKSLTSPSFPVLLL